MNADNSQTRKLVLLLSMVVLSIVFPAQAGPKPADFFTVGEHVDIQIMVPKKGFEGAPLGPTPDIRPKKPTRSEDDFDFRYVRITVLEIAKLKKNTRVALSLDEIDSNGKFVMYRPYRSKPPSHEPLYYGYLFVGPTGCRMLSARSPMHKEDGNWEPKEIGIPRPAHS